MQETWDMGSVTGLGRSPGGGHGNPLQYSCLENPWTEEPVRLHTIGSQRAGHDWSDLAHTVVSRHRCPSLKTSSRWPWSPLDSQLLVYTPDMTGRLLEAPEPIFCTYLWMNQTSLVAQTVKRLSTMWETWVWSLGREDSPGEGNDNPLQYYCLENPMDRGATVHRVAKSQTQLRDFTFLWMRGQGSPGNVWMPSCAALGLHATLTWSPAPTFTFSALVEEVGGKQWEAYCLLRFHLGIKAQVFLCSDSHPTWGIWHFWWVWQTSYFGHHNIIFSKSVA